MGKRLKRGLGRVVTGELFWDREHEKESFVEKIKEGANLLLVAQRRMGKTSLVAEVDEVLRGEGFISVFVDLQSAKSGADFVASLSMQVREYQNVWGKVRELFGDVLNNVDEVKFGDLSAKVRGKLNAGNWRIKGEQLLEILSSNAKPVVVFLDEVPIMVNRMLKGSDFKVTSERREQADEFMSWLREKSIKHQGSISFVVSGSIGLEPVLRQAGLSATINNFVAFELRP